MPDNSSLLSILIVEDNPGDLFLLEELLRTSSLSLQHLYHATTTSTAIEILQEHPIHLVFLDLSLPDSDGVNSYRLINKYALSIPVIVLTGLADMAVALETMSSGAQDYLIKGEFDEKLLYKSIQYSIERKKNLENLRESNERYEFVTRATNDVVWDWNLKTNEVYWAGENLYRLFGYTVADRSGAIDFWETSLHPDDQERVMQNLLHAIDSRKQSWEDEYQFRKKDGSYAYVIDKGFFLYEEDLPVRIIGSMQDITDRKRTENLVKDSEQRFRALVQNGSDMIKILDFDGRFTFSSPTVEKMLGWESASLLGNTFLDYIHPSDLAFTSSQFELIKKQSYLEVPYFRFKNAKGEWRWLETKLTNLLHEPSVNGIVSNSRDVTEKKKVEENIKASEERYRSLFFNNPMTIYIWDIQTMDILEVNDVAQAEYGYSREEFLRMTLLDMRPEEEFDKVKQHSIDFAESNNPKVKGTWLHLKKSNELMVMDITSHKIDFNGKPAVLTIANNITDKIRLENKLQEERQLKQKEITEAVIRVQEKERYEISKELHDNVNQQLTVAMMYIATAQKGGDNHEELLKQSSGFIYKAIEEIRKLSKALVTPLIKDFGLSKAIDGLVEDILVANTMSIEFFSDDFFEEDINYEFKLNIFRIAQEQMNNIIKHAEATQVTIELYRDQYISLAISDNGRGFDPSVRRRGIGLNNIISRAELYNGLIDMQASPGKGCKLLIKFPVTHEMLL